MIYVLKRIIFSSLIIFLFFSFFFNMMFIIFSKLLELLSIFLTIILFMTFFLDILFMSKSPSIISNREYFIFLYSLSFKTHFIMLLISFLISEQLFVTYYI